jgi:multiple sugar transport system substrate-binding protein
MKRFLSAAMICVMLIISISVVFGGAQKESGKVLFWTSQVPPELDGVKAVVDAYNATNPAVQVELVTVPGSETDVTKLMTAVRGGTGPDVYQLDRFTVPQRAADGILEDLTPFLQRIDPNVASKHLPDPWSETQYKGKTYALPFDTDARAIYYRKDLLRDAGIDPDILDPRHGPIPIERFREIAFRCNKVDAQGNYTQIGFIPYMHVLQSQGSHFTWGTIFHGSFLDMKSGKMTVTSPEVLQAYSWIHQYAQDMGPQKVATFMSTYAPPQSPPQQHPFVNGRVAMFVTSDFFINTMRTYAPEVEYGITYFPATRPDQKEPTSWSGGWSMVIPTGAKHVEAAVRFIDWACGEDGQRIYVKTTAHFPTIKSLLDEDIFAREQEIFRSIIPHSIARPVTPIGAYFWDTLYRGYDRMTLGLATPKEAAEDAQGAIQERLNRFLPLQ